MYRIGLIFGILVCLACGASAQPGWRFKHHHDYRGVRRNQVVVYYRWLPLVIPSGQPLRSRADCCYAHNSLDYYNNIYRPTYADPHY